MAFLNPQQIDQVQDALMSRDVDQCIIAIGLITTAKDARADPALLAAANDLHASDDIEIDDVAGTSPTDEGTWVQAWVWVPAPELPEAIDVDSFDAYRTDELQARADHLAQLEQPGPVDLGVDDNAVPQDGLFAELAALRAEIERRTKP